MAEPVKIGHARGAHLQWSETTVLSDELIEQGELQKHETVLGIVLGTRKMAPIKKGLESNLNP